MTFFLILLGVAVMLILLALRAQADALIPHEARMRQQIAADAGALISHEDRMRQQIAADAQRSITEARFEMARRRGSIKTQ